MTCDHGLLNPRMCGLCERDVRIATLEAENARLKEQVESYKAHFNSTGYQPHFDRMVESGNALAAERARGARLAAAARRFLREMSIEAEDELLASLAALADDAPTGVLLDAAAVEAVRVIFQRPDDELAWRILLAIPGLLDDVED